MTKSRVWTSMIWWDNVDLALSHSMVNSRMNFFWKIKQDKFLNGHFTYQSHMSLLKKLDLRGTSRPRALLYKRRISHADPENPRTPLPLLTKGPVTVWATGSGLYLCSYVTGATKIPTSAGPWPMLCKGKGEGIFLTPAWNSFPRGIEPRTWGVLLRPPNQL
jgi:hypothetical protein